MKITRIGTLLWTPNDGLSLSGWEIDTEGSEPSDDELMALVFDHVMQGSQFPDLPAMPLEITDSAGHSRAVRVSGASLRQ